MMISDGDELLGDGKAMSERVSLLYVIGEFTAMLIFGNKFKRTLSYQLLSIKLHK